MQMYSNIYRNYCGRYTLFQNAFQLFSKNIKKLSSYCLFLLFHLLSKVHAWPSKMLSRRYRLSLAFSSFSWLFQKFRLYTKETQVTRMSHILLCSTRNDCTITILLSQPGVSKLDRCHLLHSFNETLLSRCTEHAIVWTVFCFDWARPVAGSGSLIR